MTDSNGDNSTDKIKVFISYSRKDTEFVRKLYGNLGENDFIIWVDWEGIPLGTDWWNEIVEAIESADNFIFIISPDSVSSKVCNDELDIAINSNKRLVPILYREDATTVDQVKPELQAINFTFMRDDAEFDKRLPDLVEILQTDLDHVKAHTRMQARALEWERKKRSGSQLLRGDDLETAESWLAHAGGKTPPPTDLQGDYITGSRQDANKRQRRTMAFITGALIVTIFLTIFSIINMNAANIAKADAEMQRETAQAASTEAIRQEAAAVLNAEIASTAQSEAEQEREIAKSAQFAAEIAEGNAIEQEGIAVARELASIAKAALSQGNLLTRSILLTIESMKDFRNAEADQVMREGLDITPSLIVAHTYDKIPEIVRYNQDGTMLVAGDKAGNVVVMNAATGDVTQQFKHDSSITDIAFHPSQPLLLTGSTDFTARIWNLETGEAVAVLKHNGPVRAVAFNPNGLWVGTASDDNLARTWTLTTYRQLSSAAHAGPVLDIAFSPGGSWAVSAGADKAVIIWDTITGQVIHRLQHKSAVVQLQIHPTELTLAAATSDGAVHFWNMISGNEIVQISHEEVVTDMKFNQDGTLFATASKDNTARVWNTATGIAIIRLIHDKEVLAVDFNPTGTLVATASADSTARIWNLTGREVSRMEHGSIVNDVAFASNGIFLATASSDNFVRLWSHEAAGQALYILKHGVGVVDLDFNPDETLIATAGADRIMRVWDVASNSVILEIAHPSDIIDVDFSKDGTQIATGSANGEACIWDTFTGEKISCFQHDGAVMDVDFNNDGTWLATGSADDFARIWDIASGSIAYTFQTDGDVGEISLHPNGTQIATASLDHLARIWTIQTGEIVLSIEHPSGVFLVNFIPERGQLVTVSLDNTVRVWNAETGLLARKFINDNAIFAIEISKDNTKMAIASQDNITRVRDFETGVEIARIVHTAEIQDVIFNSSGTIIATASLDKRVLISLLDPTDLIHKACSRISRNLTQNEWDQFMGADKRYELTCPNLPPGTGVIENLRRVAGQYGSNGDMQAAEETLQYALTLNPSLAFDPAEEAVLVTQETFIAKAIEFTQDGKIRNAIVKFNQVRGAYNTIIASNYPEMAFQLCRKADEFPEFVSELIEACQVAVALDPENGLVYDARGIAYVHLGKYQEAISDFEFAVEWKQNDPSASKSEIQSYVYFRLEWIEALKNGTNPFDR